MFDINKTITDPGLLDHDPEGHMYDLAPWTRNLAQNLARQEGLGDLSEMQWRVIYHLRGQYRRTGCADTVRHLMRGLEEEFADEGGRRHLYRLFPQGPATQGSRLAGVPAPTSSRQPTSGSFGCRAMPGASP